jgi:hypothetical protein
MIRSPHYGESQKQSFYPDSFGKQIPLFEERFWDDLCPDPYPTAFLYP